MSTKLSHKALKEMGKALGGHYFDGNIYYHQNRAHYLTAIVNSFDKERTLAEAKRMNPESAELFDFALSIGADYACSNQLAYSCGYYGNTGQLHEIKYFSKGGEHLNTIFIYC